MSKKGHNSIGLQCMLEKEDNSAKYLQNFVKIKSGHLNLGQNLCAKYHGPSSSGSPAVLSTRFHRFIMHVKKGA